MAVSVPRRKSTRIQPEPSAVNTFGAFPFAGHVPIGRIADFYGLPVCEAEKAAPVGDFIADRLPAKPAPGDGVGIGMILLLVLDVNGDRITRVGLRTWTACLIR
jgi:cell volume regulation protein A